MWAVLVLWVSCYSPSQLNWTSKVFHPIPLLWTLSTSPSAIRRALSMLCMAPCYYTITISICPFHTTSEEISQDPAEQPLLSLPNSIRRGGIWSPLPSVMATTLGGGPWLMLIDDLVSYQPCGQATVPCTQIPVAAICNSKNQYVPPKTHQYVPKHGMHDQEASMKWLLLLCYFWVKSRL